jgi:hypothetical protein
MDWMKQRVKEMEEKTINSGFSFEGKEGMGTLAGDDAYYYSIACRLDAKLNIE